MDTEKDAPEAAQVHLNMVEVYELWMGKAAKMMPDFGASHEQT